MLIEEHFLTQTYAAYADYAKNAKRLIPFVY
jgi:protein-S-isoprenylcysteine O-methyltransferase Ste14